MAANRTNARFYTRDDVFGSITPNNVRQREIATPQGEWKPASWLPIQFTKNNRDSGTDAFVISSGKVVAQDRQGRIVPAGLRAALHAGLVTATVLSYTSDDVEWGVIDLTTGEAVSAATSYTGNQVALALLERGLVPAEFSADGLSPAADTFDYSSDSLTIAQIAEIVEAWISEAVGVVLYDVHVYSGQPQDGDMYYDNYSKQAHIQFATELQMVVPHRVASSNTSDSVNFTTVIVTTAPGGDGDFIAPGEIWDSGAINALTRYSGEVADGDSVHAVGLDPEGGFANGVATIAANTDRTPFESDTDGVLTSQKSSIGLINEEGDWYLDAEVGVLFIHSDTYTTLTGVGAVGFSYYFYDSSSAGADAHQYPHFDGEARPGDYLGYDALSNYVVLGSTPDISGGTKQDSIGRIHYVLAYPRTLLDKVKTAFSLTGMAASGKMPGSATEGYSDAITLSQEDVSDQVAVLTIRI